MSNQLLKKRIVLTGVSRGIGLASARLLLQEGASLVGVARSVERLASVTSELEALGDFHPLPLDLTSPAAAERLHTEVTERWGALDLLVHNAGVMLAHDAEISGEVEGLLERSLEHNLLAPFRISRALAPLLERGETPRIINVSSGAGTRAGLEEPGIASYRLSKWALNGLTLLQAKEYTARISVLALDPGWVKTDLGGPNAPGLPEDSARGLLKAVLLPWSETGIFVKDGAVIPW